MTRINEVLTHQTKLPKENKMNIITKNKNRKELKEAGDKINAITVKVINSIKGANQYAIATACYIDGEFVLVSHKSIPDTVKEQLRANAEKMKG